MFVSQSELPRLYTVRLIDRFLTYIMFTIQQTYCCFQLFIGGHYLELMESRVKRVKESKNEIERSQNWLLRSIYRLMRQIALLQVCNAAL